VMNIADGKEDTLYVSQAGDLTVAVGKDFAKILVAEGSVGPELEIGGNSTIAPYKTFTIDVSNKQSVSLAELPEALQGLGFMLDGSPYAVTDKKVIELGGSRVPYETG